MSQSDSWFDLTKGINQCPKGNSQVYFVLFKCLLVSQRRVLHSFIFSYLLRTESTELLHKLAAGATFMRGSNDLFKKTQTQSP